MALADMGQALDALNPSLRTAIDGRRARHGRLPPPSQPLSAAHPYDEERAHLHPLVIAHPRTGRLLLHLPRHPDSTVEGLCDDDGRELLRELWRHVEAADIRVQMPQRSHDLVVWDNLRCLHTNPRVSGVAAREVWFATLGDPVTPAA
jgi:taurine dioxygenase